MVVANRQGRYKYSIKGELNTQENGQNSQKPNKIKQSFFGRAVAMACVVAIVGAVIIVYIHQFVQISTTNYEINQLKKEVAAIQEENDTIRLQILQNKNLKRIEQEAREKLGMIDPSQKETCYIPVQKKSTVEAVSVEPSEVNNFVFVRDMMTWLKNLTSVEAGTLEE